MGTETVGVDDGVDAGDLHLGTGHAEVCGAGVCEDAEYQHGVG